MIEAMRRELVVKKEIFGKHKFNSIYFGGGTPSVLKADQIELLLNDLYAHYDIGDNPEISFEANPDDLRLEYLTDLKTLGINRLSIGIQSFLERDLEIMRRSHTAKQAVLSVENAKRAGFTSFSVDLIYGIPGLSSGEWDHNLQQFLSFEIPHLSAYHLTFEPGTVFDHWRKKNRITPVDEEISLQQFTLLKERLQANSYIHYEISNFGLEGYFSAHNQIYWEQKAYLGLGPSAHSYDGSKRYWNISNNKKYIQLVLDNSTGWYDYEILSATNRYNEYCMTGLRTRKGINTVYILQEFGEKAYAHCTILSRLYVQSGHMVENHQNHSLTDKGILLSDAIIENFFLLEGEL